MSARLDRLIARVVDGAHEIRAPRPAMFEDTLADADELPEEIDVERRAPLAIRPAPNAAVRASIDPLPAAPRREAPSARQVEAPRVDERPAASALHESNARRSAPMRVEAVPPQQTGFPPANDTSSTQASAPQEGQRIARTSRAAVPPTPRFRTPAVREHVSNAPGSHSQPAPVDVPAAEPDRITIEIGRIDVGGPARGPERMLTLDAYRTTRREGGR